MSNNEDTINSIRNLEKDIESIKDDIKVKKEMIDSHVQNKQEWLDLESAKEEVKRLNLKLKMALMKDSDYNNALEDLGQIRDKMKDQKELLSDFIVGYKLETHEDQIEMNDNGDARQLVLKGKLGKRGKYQTNIFNNRS